MRLSASRPYRTGLLGGSFNPAHAGHRAISLEIMAELHLDEIWWLVSPGNPLKARAADMAALSARLASANHMARRSRIVPTVIEQHLGTRYSHDSLRAIQNRYRNRRFIWLMGADNLANFHRWKRWRDIAKQMPIAVIARPGYNDDALAAPAMHWFGRFVRPRSQGFDWTRWRPPALVLLRFRPDPHSATAIRRANPLWHSEYAGKAVRDRLTYRLIYSAAAFDGVSVTGNGA